MILCPRQDKMILQAILCVARSHGQGTTDVLSEIRTDASWHSFPEYHQFRTVQLILRHTAAVYLTCGHQDVSRKPAQCLSSRGLVAPGSLDG
jgi:hypothetical protein